MFLPSSYTSKHKASLECSFIDVSVVVHFDGEEVTGIEKGEISEAFLKVMAEAKEVTIVIVMLLKARGLRVLKLY